MQNFCQIILLWVLHPFALHPKFSSNVFSLCVISVSSIIYRLPLSVYRSHYMFVLELTYHGMLLPVAVGAAYKWSEEAIRIHETGMWGTGKLSKSIDASSCWYFPFPHTADFYTGKRSCCNRRTGGGNRNLVPRLVLRFINGMTVGIAHAFRRCHA